MSWIIVYRRCAGDLFCFPDRNGIGEALEFDTREEAEEGLKEFDKINPHVREIIEVKI